VQKRRDKENAEKRGKKQDKDRGICIENAELESRAGYISRQHSSSKFC
jgi:hypothetical protein